MTNSYINNTEHKCAGRTDGYGGFTCVRCGAYRTAEEQQSEAVQDLHLDPSRF